MENLNNKYHEIMNKVPKVPKGAKKKAKKLRKVLEEEDKKLLSNEGLVKDDRQFVKRGFKLKGFLTRLKEKRYKKK